MKEFEIAFPILETPSDDDFKRASAKSMGLPLSKVGGYQILKKSIDARSSTILSRYRVVAYSDSEVAPSPFSLDVFQNVALSTPVIVVGAGPAGIFAALRLIQRGFKPIILERGKDVHRRKYDTAALSREGILNPDSNYCFGEGGAGTFSDGKLYTRSNKRGDIREVLHLLVHFGADPAILTDAHPHIGSDRLPSIIEKIRECIVQHGGEYHFDSKVVDIRKVGDQWRVNAGCDYSAKYIILATGHSATDIYEMFYRKGWEVQPKGFALGVRVEHPQMLINQSQYHNRFQSYLPPAEYSLVTQVDGRGVFSFCMCPGGILVPSSTNEGGLVLNGMSNSMRNSKWANAGIVVSVEPADVGGEGPLTLLQFQKEVEKRAFAATNSFKAPSQRMTDFCRSKFSPNLPASSYSLGAVSAQLDEILPDFVSSRLKKAFPLFDKKLKGYYTSEALLLAVESRTSSTVRIPRNNETLEHITLKGLFPCGEGAGYAGGIVSSALDGINCAEKVGDN